MDEKDQFNDIKKLFKDKSEYKTNRMHEKAEELGLNTDELLSIGLYKKRWNAIVHKRRVK